MSTLVTALTGESGALTTFVSSAGSDISTLAVAAAPVLFALIGVGIVLKVIKKVTGR